MSELSTSLDNRRQSVGPGQRISLIFTFDLLRNGSGIGCGNCDGQSGTSGRFTRTTEAVRSPQSVSVSEEEFGTPRLTWTNTTEFPTPDYRIEIYRDDLSNQLADLPGGTTTWTDDTACPGENHTYYLLTQTSAFGNQASAPTSLLVDMPDAALNATSSGSNLVALSWTNLSMLDNLQGFSLKRLNDELGSYVEIVGGLPATASSARDDNPIPGVVHQYRLDLLRGGMVFTCPALETQGSVPANGRISGQVLDVNNAPVANVQVCATLQSDISGSDAGTVYCDSTDASGSYALEGIYYYEQATFRVVPLLEFHRFSPPSRDVRLRREAPEATANFDDPADNSKEDISIVFTPNGDGSNDTFIIPELLNNPADFPDNSLTVFNRWGDVVYEAKPYNNDWDGTHYQTGEPLPPGTYFYLARLRIVDGLIRKERVTLIR